jgi:hypothetical protein
VARFDFVELLHPVNSISLEPVDARPRIPQAEDQAARRVAREHGSVREACRLAEDWSMVSKVRLMALAGVVAAQALVSAQGGDVNKILADARVALGGDKKLDAVKTLTMAGRSLRTTSSGTTNESEFELSIELPDKYMRRDAVVNMGNMSIYRMSGFNGDGLINEMDTPPQLAGGGNMVVRFRTADGGGAVPPGGTPTPEQQEASRRAMLTVSRQDFARLTLGMFAKSFAAYPLTMTYVGQAEAPDGKADVIEVKGEGEFSVRLFVDATTHLPLMLSWMAKEPLVMVRQMTGGPGGDVVKSGGTAGSGGGAVKIVGGSTFQMPAPNANMTPEEREKMMAQLAEQAKEAEAKRKIVEYRLFYSNYQTVDGIKIPHTLQRSVDGKPAEEVTVDKVKVNGKIDAKTFTVSK